MASDNNDALAQSRVLEFREARNLTQEALAAQCGLTRQAVSAIEAGDYFPNSIAALHMARALGCRVEDLFTFDDEAPALPVKVVGRDVFGERRANVVKVRNKMLALPLSPGRQLLEGFTSADAVLDTNLKLPKARLLIAPADLERTALMVGCDPGLSIVSAHLSRRTKDVRLVLMSGSSQAALNAVRRGEAHLAGTHLPDAEKRGVPKAAARALAKRGGLVVAFARWEQGLMMAHGNRKSIRSIEDLARRDVRVINREIGSGSRALLDDWIRRAGISAKKIRGYDLETHSHLSVAHAVQYGAADVGVGLRAVALACGLEFIPLADVRFDFVVPKDLLAHPAVAALLDLLQSKRLRAELAMLPGYDVGCMGEVMARVGES